MSVGFRRPRTVAAFASLVPLLAVLGCNALVSLDGLAEAPESASDDSSVAGPEGSSDAGVGDAVSGEAHLDASLDADSDAPALGCDGGAALFCESFDGTFAINTLVCTSATATITTASPASPPNALRVQAAAGGWCQRTYDFAVNARTLHLSFRVRFASANARVHVLSFGVRTAAGYRTALVNVYPDQISVMEAFEASSSFPEHEPFARALKLNQWMKVDFTLKGLDTAQPTSSLVFDGDVVETDHALTPTWAPGTAYLELGLGFSEGTSNMQLDDVVLENF